MQGRQILPVQLQMSTSWYGTLDACLCRVRSAGGNYYRPVLTLVGDFLAGACIKSSPYLPRRATQHLVSWQQAFTRDYMPERTSSGMHRTRGASSSSTCTSRMSSCKSQCLSHTLPLLLLSLLSLCKALMRRRKRFVFVNLDACMASQGVTLTVLQQLKACPRTTPSPLFPKLSTAMSSPCCHLQRSNKYAVTPCQ